MPLSFFLWSKGCLFMFIATGYDLWNVCTKQVYSRYMLGIFLHFWHIDLLYSLLKVTPSQFLIVMPLVSMIKSAITSIRSRLSSISPIHLTAANAHECRNAILIFTSPEVLVDGKGRSLLQSGLNIKAVFIDEFHIVQRWLVAITCIVW